LLGYFINPIGAYMPRLYASLYLNFCFDRNNSSDYLDFNEKRRT
jgi:hypothetical protein